MMILSGDIGGTKTSLMLFCSDTGPEEPEAEQIFASRDYGSLEEIIEVFLEKERPGTIQGACFAIAGPMLSGTTTVTNLPWTVKTASLTDTLGIKRIKLLNDVQAVASSVPHLDKSDLKTLSTGNPIENGTIAVIAPGTGLGEAFLVWNGTSYQSHPTEGGHADFGPSGSLQAGLLEFMSRRMDHVSWETVCSGIGIPNIYDYLNNTGLYKDRRNIENIMESGTERTPAIIRAVTDRDPPCALCADTMEMFVSILGAEAGNLSLKTIATGGLYLGGGIPPRILKILTAGTFMKAFKSKGRLSSMMDEIPVKVILNPRAALIGAGIEAVSIAGYRGP